jgi:hypothetical protein
MPRIIRKSLVVILAAWSLSAPAARAAGAASVHASLHPAAVLRLSGQLRSHSSHEIASTAASLLAWAELSDESDNLFDGSSSVETMRPSEGVLPLDLTFPASRPRSSLVSQHVQLQI